jgi:hypothetical protein
VPAVVGAVYSPLVSTSPTLLLPPSIPSTDQVTELLLVFCTVAPNCCVSETVNDADVGLIVIRTVAPVTVTCALADLVLSSTLVAVTV